MAETIKTTKKKSTRKTTSKKTTSKKTASKRSTSKRAKQEPTPEIAILASDKDKVKTKSMDGNWVITDLNSHINSLMKAAIDEKRKLVKEKKFKENKKKKLRYKLVDGEFIKAKKGEVGKNVVNVRYD